MQRPALTICALLTGCFALGVTVEPKLAFTKTYERHDRSPFEVVLGESRQLFARHFFAKADIYFHSWYYPSIFDQGATNHHSHLATEAEISDANDHKDEGEFLGEPMDCIDKFSRAFFPSSHTHLDEHSHTEHTQGDSAAHEEEETA